MVRWGWLALACLGCPAPGTGEPPGDRGPADADTDTDADTDADTDPTGTTDLPPVPASASSAGPVACADPSDRANLGSYELKHAPEMPLEGAFLAGGGIVAADFTGDGQTDFFLPSEQAVQFWIQTATGDLSEQHLEAFGVDTLPMAVGGVAGDLDDDGDMDLVVTRFDATIQVWRNDGSGRFADVSASAGVDQKVAKWQSASLADWDLDGDLDLAVGAYGEKPEDAFSTQLPPGDPSAFYVNDGDGTFTDRSDLLPAWVQEAYTFMTAWYDVNGDHYPELFVVNDFASWRHSEMLINLGGTGFALAGAATTGFQQDFFGMGLGVGDVNYDDQPDFLLTSWKDVALLTTFDSALGLLWVDSAASAGITWHEGQIYGWGTELYDADNDMDLDAVIGYGLWSAYPYNRDRQPDSLWLNRGTTPLAFDEVADSPEWQLKDESVTRGVAVVDVNRDGWLDLIKRDLRADTLLRIARCGEAAWIEVLPRQSGRNAFAIGAKVRVTAGGVRQTRWVQAGSSSMYTSLPPEVHVGLGDHATADVEIVWPDGRVSSLPNLDTRQRYTVTRQD
jgi:hypothetical protein